MPDRKEPPLLRGETITPPDAGPQIDLEPHEYHRAGEQRVTRLLLLASVGLLLLAFWQTDLLVNWRAWVVAFFAVLFGMALVGAFPNYWFRRDD